MFFEKELDDNTKLQDSVDIFKHYLEVTEFSFYKSRSLSKTNFTPPLVKWSKPSEPSH